MPTEKSSSSWFGIRYCHWQNSWLPERHVSMRSIALRQLATNAANAIRVEQTHQRMVVLLCTPSERRVLMTSSQLPAAAIAAQQHVDKTTRRKPTFETDSVPPLRPPATRLLVSPKAIRCKPRPTIRSRPWWQSYADDPRACTGSTICVSE